jgi:hypothetical protein
MPFVGRFKPRLLRSTKIPLLAKLFNLKKLNVDKSEAQPSPFGKLRAGSAGLSLEIEFGRTG